MLLRLYLASKNIVLVTLYLPKKAMYVESHPYILICKRFLALSRHRPKMSDSKAWGQYRV